jgi:hypothetical protein
MSDIEMTEQEVVKTKKPKRVKHDLPEGFVTPVGFVKALKELLNIDVRPQVIYGHVKNSKSFQEFTTLNSDGRTMLNLDAAIAWWNSKDERKLEREAEKAAKAEGAEISEEN